jgi:hypothetical protein
MRLRSVPFSRSATVLFFTSVSALSAWAQDAAPAVMDHLKTYKLVKLAPDSNGLAVVQPGTVLVIQKGGLLGIPPANLVFCSAKYQDGEVKAAGGFCAAMVKDVSRFFQIGDKVYPLKIDLNVKKEQISFKVVACDSCNGTDPPSFYKSEVVFQFAKGFLESAPAGAVQQAISQVFTLDAGDARPAQAAQPAARAPAPPATAPPPPVEAPPPPPIEAPPPPVDQPPTTISVGQTVDQVTAALGQPQRMAKVGAKQIYFYKDLKVTFTNGKVSDVE